MKIDNTHFNADFYKGKSEDEFVKDQLPSVLDKYGNTAQKTEWLKAAYAKMNEKPGQALQPAPAVAK